jgi:hypothetical protein
MTGRAGLPAAAFAVAAAVALVGCGPPPDPSAALTPSAHPPFVDVPVPSGFEREQDKSMAGTSEAGRVAHLVYWGKAPLTAVSRFYKTEMTRSHGWTQGTETLAEGAVELHFAKRDAIAMIRLEPHGDKCEISILLGEVRGP